MNDEHRFPDIDSELRPTAERVADALRTEVPPEVAERHEELLRARAAGGDVRPLRSARRRARRTLVSLAAAAVLVLALPIVAVASDRAVPGDLLYGVDRAVERLELVIATGPTNETQALLDQAGERVEELEALEERDRLEHVRGLLRDLRETEEQALETAGADEALSGTVLSALELHTQRLQEVRDRLSASGKASPRALSALDRAIDAGRGATGADERGRPDDTRPPEDSRQERPDDAPGGPPTEPPSERDDTGPPEGTPGQAPADRPAGPEDRSQTGQSGGQENEQPPEDGSEFGRQQAEAEGEGEGGDSDGDGGSPPPTGGPEEGGPPDGD